LRLSKNTYRAIAFTLLIIAGGLYYFNKEETTPPPAAQEEKDNAAATVTFAGSSIVEQLDGKKQWELSAETVQVNPGTNKAKLLNFKGIIYRQDGSKIDLVGRQAEIDTKTKDIDMSGDIKATDSNGPVFTAAQGRWAGGERRFYGSGGITLTREDTIVTGDRIESDEHLEKVKVSGHARVLKGGTPDES